MTTLLIWKSLDIYARIFQYFHKIPLLWDTKSRRFVHVSNQKELFIWYFNVIVALGLASVGSGLFVTFRTIFQRDHSNPLIAVFMQFLICVVLGGFGLCMALGIVMCGSFAAVTLNAIIDLENTVRRDILSVKDAKPELPPKIDLFGLGIIGSVFIMSIYPFLIALLAVVVEADVYIVIIRDIIPPEVLHRPEIYLILLFLRTCLCFVVPAEVCKMYALFLIALALSLKITGLALKCLIIEQRVQKVFLKMNSYRVLYQSISGLLETAVFVHFGLGLLICIMVNYITVKLYGIVPNTIYGIAPPLSILVPFIMHSCLPKFIEYHEKTSKLLQKWRWKLVFFSNQKYLRRRLRAIRTISVKGGMLDFRFFQVDNRIKSQYYFAIVDYTITALLSVPPEAFQSNYI